MLKRIISCALILLAGTHAKSQTSTISYAGLFNPPCNVFGSAVNVDGYSHKTTYGQPSLGSFSVALPTKLYGLDDLRSGFKINYNFVAGDQYTISVNARTTVFGTPVVLYLYYGNTTASASACNGPEAKPTSGLNEINHFTMSSDFFIDYTANFFPSTNQSNLFIDAAAFNNANSIAYMEIAYITITHTAAPPPATFTISSSVSSRTCGQTLLAPITFTVNNVNSTPNVTGYDYIVTPYQWTTALGVPVTTTISSTSNSIQLKPVECMGGNSITVIPYINNVAQTPVTRNITVNIPTISITGPSSLTSAAGLYNLVGTPVCGNSTNWSIDNTTLAQLSVNSNTQAGVQKRSGFGVPSSGVVTLKASIPQCGINAIATKTITISTLFARPGQGGATTGVSSVEENDDYFRVFPNPATDNITLQFNNSSTTNEIALSDVTGKVVLKKSVSGSLVNVDLSDYSIGVYFLRVTDGTFTKVSKIVKQ